MTKEEYEEKAEVELAVVPEQYREGCKSLAWELGHSHGSSEVYYYLQDIVERIFGR